MFQFMQSIPELNTHLKNHLTTFEFMRSLPSSNDEVLVDELEKTQSLMPHGGKFHQKSYFFQKYKDRPDILQDMLESAEQMCDTDTEEMLLRDTKVGRTDDTVHKDACKDEHDGEEDGSPPAKKLKPGDNAKLESAVKAMQNKVAEIDVSGRNSG